jgi:L-seryl-tRNA(Ser) seleniumtransferase
MNLAGLTATVLHYLKQEAEAEVPIWRMISASEEGIKDRAARWKTQLSLPGEVISGRSAVGGGSLPGETLPTWVLALSCEGDAGGPERVMRRLREANPPVVARIEDDRVILDPRTVMPEEEESLLTALRDALSR